MQILSPLVESQLTPPLKNKKIVSIYNSSQHSLNLYKFVLFKNFKFELIITYG